MNFFSNKGEQQLLSTLEEKEEVKPESSNLHLTTGYLEKQKADNLTWLSVYSPPPCQITHYILLTSKRYEG